jgi:hypothetical protein
MEAAMSRHDRIPSQLRHLAPAITDEETRDRRWWRLQEQHVAEIDLDRIECAALKAKVIAECKRQNGRVG